MCILYQIHFVHVDRCQHWGVIWAKKYRLSIRIGLLYTWPSGFCQSDEHPEFKENGTLHTGSFPISSMSGFVSATRVAESVRFVHVCDTVCPGHQSHHTTRMAPT